MLSFPLTQNPVQSAPEDAASQIGEPSRPTSEDFGTFLARSEATPVLGSAGKASSSAEFFDSKSLQAQGRNGRTVLSFSAIAEFKPTPAEEAESEAQTASSMDPIEPELPTTSWAHELTHMSDAQSKARSIREPTSTMGSLEGADIGWSDEHFAADEENLRVQQDRATAAIVPEGEARQRNDIVARPFLGTEAGHRHLASHLSMQAALAAAVAAPATASPQLAADDLGSEQRSGGGHAQPGSSSVEGFTVASLADLSRNWGADLQTNGRREDSIRLQLQTSFATPIIAAQVGETKIQLRLDPPELGQVTVEVEKSERGTRIVMHVENPVAHRLLESNIKSLAEALDSAGVTLLDLDVFHGSTDRDGFQGDQPTGRARTSADTEVAPIVESEDPGHSVHLSIVDIYV